MKEEGEHGCEHKRRTNPSSFLAAEKAESCAVCTSNLSFSSEPKLLPCLHIMCKACWVKSTQDNSARECPVCGQSFNLSEVTDCFLFEDSVPKCGGCEESDISGWCQECEEALCSDCVSAHQRVKVTRNHTVILQEPRSGLTTSLRCTSHKLERLKFFCVVCNQLTCRDCQLIDHRNHSFLLIEEAVVTQKEQLIKLLDSIKEQKNNVRARLQDLEGRLNNIKELKALSRKQLYNELRSLYTTLVFRCQQLSKELEGLCNEEEQNLNVMKSTLKMLEDRHEYMIAFLHKLLSTEGQCILRHKTQIEKWAQRVLSQRKCLPVTVIHLSLSVNEHISHNIKNFASFKVTRVLPPAKEKCYNGDKLKNAPKDADRCRSGLNSESDATLSVSGTTDSQVTVPSTFQAASDFPPFRQSKSASSKPVQPTQRLTDIRSHPSSSSASCNFDLSQTTQSNTAQCAVTQLLPQFASPQASQSQQVFRKRSHPLLTTILQSSSSLPSQTVLKIIPTNRPRNSIVMPKTVVPQSQSGVVHAAAASPGFTSCPSVAHPSILVHTATFPSSNSINPTNTQSRSLTSNQFVPSFITLAPFTQSMLNSSSNHIQQSIFQSQAVSGHSFPPKIASTNKFLPHISAVSNTQSVNLQPFQSVIPQSNELQFAQLKLPSDISSLKVFQFHHYAPVLTVNKSTTLTCAPQPAPEVTIVPVRSSNKDLDPPVSSAHQLPAASISNVCSNNGLMACGSQTIQIPKCELPVKAPADSICEGDTSVCSRASPVADESDSNLPTSTVPEDNTKVREVSAVHQPRDLLSTSLFTDCPSEQSIPTSSKSPHKSTSTLSFKGNPSIPHSSTGLPSSFRELLSGEKMVIAKDSCSRSALDLEQVPFPNAKEDDENTDNKDSESVEGMDEFEEEPILRQDDNKTPLVSLLRLPISGSTLSQFRIVPSSQKDVILLQEIEENQSIRRCLRIAAASPSQSCSSECSLQDDVHDCAVCLSAGALLQCAECGRSFHTNCHVPPILCNPIEMWVCSLCQDLLDDTDPFKYDRPTEPYLSLPDQRRCEQILLTLMCANNSYLLYKTIKQTAGCVEFNLIVARLSGKCSPPYRSAAEMVSDLWALFDKLSSNSKKKDLIAKLQSAFQQQLNVSFGKSLHASLLRPLSSRDQTGAPETDLGRDMTTNTLKRMREFLAANCTTQVKKAHTEGM